MERSPLASFLESAADALVRARGTLLLHAQSGEPVELGPVAATIQDVAIVARELQLEGVAAKAEVCSSAIAAADASANGYLALDRISDVEAELLDATSVEEYSDEIEDLVDGSIDELIHETSAPDLCSEFPIDAEILEIFRSEGEELLAAISLGIDLLAASPTDQSALWDIRRSSHTFKGAAGIVGLTEAASLAHRMEDLLDRLVESSAGASTEVLEFLRGCVESLQRVIDGAPANASGLEFAYSSAVASLTKPAAKRSEHSAEGTRRTPEQRPSVRVSVERLSEIIELAEQLLRNAPDDHGSIAAKIHDKLVRIRLVRFGTLETRLARAVTNAAQEEGKRAVLELETPDVEIDTLLVDALVEPLIHVLKNAVVHGIERPEMRRLLGKHEFGLVSIRVNADKEATIITISDDGAGISTSKLKQKAVAKKLVDPEAAAELSERDAYKLLFARGLTTADKIDLNAGRGIGMGIVKESIEALGGSVHVASAPQLGTTFTLILPVNASKPARATAADTARLAETHAAQPAVSESPLVLVVEDSASIRRHNQRIVENQGMRCITAENGADALEILLDGTIRPDLILSDVEMPHVDGWQLLEYLKTDEQLGSIPVVLVTSLDTPKHKSLAESLGSSGYVVKPLTTDDLSAVMQLDRSTTAAV